MELLVNYCFDTRYAVILSSHSGLHPGEAFLRWFFFERVDRLKFCWVNLIWSGSLVTWIPYSNPRAGLRIPKPRILDSKTEKFVDSGIWIPVHGAISCKIVAEVEKKSCWILRQWPKREALEFCCCSAETEWRSCGILLLENLLESFVRSQVDYKELSRLTMSSCQWRLKFTSR